MVAAIFTPDKSELPMRQPAIEGMEWVGKRCANKITGAPLANRYCVRYSFPVRCGNPAACRSMNPEFLAGLCGPKAPTCQGLPSQGPAPLSTWGLSFLGLTGLVLGREDDSGPSEKRYWQARLCNTAQKGGEASALESNGWRVSMSALGID